MTFLPTGPDEANVRLASALYRLTHYVGRTPNLDHHDPRAIQEVMGDLAAMLTAMKATPMPTFTVRVALDQPDMPDASIYVHQTTLGTEIHQPLTQNARLYTGGKLRISINPLPLPGA